MAKKVYLKGEEFVFTKVKGSSETDYREGDVNINPANIGLGNVNNTSDADKPVSTAQRKAIDDAYANSNKYTDQKIANLINGAPETMDTLKEVADAISASKTTEEALNKAIGKKANQTELDTHTGNDTIHITASEREKWNKNGGVTGVRGSAESDYKTGQVTISKENIGLGNVENTKDADKNVNSAEYLKMYDNDTQSSALVRFEHAPLSMATEGVEVVDPSYVPIGYDATNHLLTYGEKIDTADEVVTFTSGDSSTGDSTAPAVITSGETHKSLFNKISTTVKNVRWLLSKMGTTDISAIGNGTVTGALSTLNSNKKWSILTSGSAVQITEEMVAKYEEFKFILTYNNQVLAEATYPSATGIISASEDRILRLGGYYQSSSNFAMFGVKKTSDRYFRTSAGWYLNCINNDWIEPTITLCAR